jgi:hypothetical protein
LNRAFRKYINIEIYKNFKLNFLPIVDINIFYFLDKKTKKDFVDKKKQKNALI